MSLLRTEYPNIGETLYSCELENGLKIFVIPKPGFSSCFAVFGTSYGGAMRRFTLDGETIDTPAGVAHFLEHKMFDMPDGDNALSMLSENGADANAFTSSSVTCYHFRCTNRFEENLRLLLHFVSTPYFTPETVQKEQGIIGQEIQMGDDNPGSAIYYNLLSLLYAHHPIRDKVAGTVESIAEITDETLYACHKVFYAPSNMVLCVEGDVDPEQIRSIAEQELTKERSSVPCADFGEAEDLFPVSPRKEVSMPVSAPQFLIGAKVKDSTGTAEEILRSRLTGSIALRLLLGNSSPFYTRLYADGTLNRDFDFEIDASAGTVTAIIGGESPNPDAVLTALNEEIASLAATGFHSAYFERTMRSTIGSRLRGLEDFDDVCVSLAMGIMEGYCTFDAMEMLHSIRKEDCEAWISENLAPEKLAVSIVRPLKADI